MSVGFLVGTALMTLVSWWLFEAMFGDDVWPGGPPAMA